MEKKNTDLSASEQARLLDDIKLLQEVSAAISEQVDDDALYERLIDGAARIMHSDFASMHMLNAEGGQPGNLRLLACRGLNSRANKFWAWVPADGEGSCAHALLTGTRVIVPDVEAYDFVNDGAELATYRDTGIRAMQCTPLRTRNGNLLGMLSTHWRVPHEPTERDFRLFDIIARQASDLIEHRLAREATAADLRSMQLLQALGNLCTNPAAERDDCLRAALKAATAIAGADYGNIQLLDPSSQTLTIAAKYNFAEPFLNFFREVTDSDASACAATMRAGGRTIVEDITNSDVFRCQPSLQILLDAGVRAVQSTALVSSAGTLLGMLSTHWRKPHRPTERDLHLLDLLTRQLADFLERKAAEETRRLLIDELNHRAKNLLATVQSIATQTLRRAASPAAFVSDFEGRLHALAKAHTLLTQADWQEADLKALLERELYLNDTNDPRITCSGPDLALTAQMALQVALVVHELTTNARKYGALSVPDGKLSVTWSVVSDGVHTLHLRWVEVSGKKHKLSVASKQGFGSTLIQAVTGNRAELENRSDGIAWKLAINLPAGSARTERRRTLPRQATSLKDSHTPLTGKRVLIVEDELVIGLELAAILEAAKIHVIGPANTITTGRALIAKETIDAALLDINLGGDRGEELAHDLTRARVPFAFLTGYGREALLPPFQATAMIAKPFGAEQVLSELRHLLSGSAHTVTELRPKRR